MRMSRLFSQLIAFFLLIACAECARPAAPELAANEEIVETSRYDW